jgi:beta-lactamase superfamily II metal-dependent hydrolase
MNPHPIPSRRAFRIGLALACVLACGSEPPGPADRTPVITISGIQDGAVVTGPVTITIEVDIGTYLATLNGETFVSGRTVSGPDDYALSVTARNGDANAAATVAFTIALSGDTRLIIRVFDLGPNEAGGGGDAILLTDSSHAGLRHVLVDAGPAGPAGGDPGFVARRLATLGVDTLEALVLSHAHGDHFDGMTAVLSQVVVLRFVYNGQVRNFGPYTGLVALATSQAGTVVVPETPTPLTVGFGGTASVVTLLPPLGTYLANENATSSEINEGSLGAELAKGPFRMFLTGDGEVQANLRWRNTFASRAADVSVLKVGHHGANDAVFDNGFSGTSAWLQHAAPAVAVISANGGSHPRQNAIAALLGLPATITFCTHVHGDLEIRVGEHGDYQVTPERNPGAACVAGTDGTP